MPKKTNHIILQIP